MKIKFTKKIILDSIEIDGGIKIIQFASYLKEEFIERLIKISIKNNKIVNIYFSSNDYGTATWVINKGFVDCHRWETEDDLRQISYLAKLYPALLENGIVPVDYVFEKIIPDILENMIDTDLSFDIFRIIKSPDENITCDWDDIINKNKKLSNEFMNSLILKYENEIKELEISDKEEEKKENILLKTKISINKNIFFVNRNIEQIKNVIKYLSFKFHKIKIFFKNHNVIKEADSKIRSQENSKEVDNIKDYLENAKKLSRKIKKF